MPPSTTPRELEASGERTEEEGRALQRPPPAALGAARGPLSFYLHTTVTPLQKL